MDGPAVMAGSAEKQLVHRSQIEEPTEPTCPARKEILIDLGRTRHVPSVLSIIEGFERFYLHNRRDAWRFTTVTRKSPGPCNPSR
jgi:hypothetical protein